jgi:large subunit ribosomal protein L25
MLSIDGTPSREGKVNENITLPAQERTMTGKGGARKVRAAGQCPAVLYGRGVEPRALQVDPKLLEKLMSSASGENTLIDLEISVAGDKPPETTKVIIRDLQYRPLGDLPSHIDFYQVSLDRAINMTVPLDLIGTPGPVERKEGTLSQQLYELNIECLPGNIPSNIEVDISGLEVGQSVHVSDLPSLSGVTVVDSPGLSIASVKAMKEEVVEEEEISADLETAEPEVIGAEKTEGEGEPG